MKDTKKGSEEEEESGENEKEEKKQKKQSLDNNRLGGRQSAMQVRLKVFSSSGRSPNSRKREKAERFSKKPERRHLLYQANKRPCCSKEAGEGNPIAKLLSQIIKVYMN